jgi:hypothetical protein
VALAVLTGLALAAAAGCAPRGRDARMLGPPVDPRRSIVYGYIDMAEASTRLEWMEFRQLAPPTGTPYYQMRVHEGIFYMEKFPPGTFRMTEFGGRLWNGRQLAYSMPRQSPALQVVITEPGLYFLGSFRYRADPAGHFEIDRIASPSASEVLRKLLPFARGSDWEELIRARLGGQP